MADIFNKFTKIHMGHYSLMSYTTLVFYFRREKGGVGGGLFATYIEPGIEGQKPHLKICSQNTLLESSDCWPADAAVFLALTRCLLMQARWLYGGKKNSFSFSVFLVQSRQRSIR